MVDGTVRQMKIIVGSKTQRKILIVEKVLTNYLRSKYLLDSFKAASGVPETPWNEETYQGAQNRAEDCQNNNPDADLCIGLESGLVERFGHLFEEAWCCILTKNGEKYYGYSSGLKLPDSIIQTMHEKKMQHFEVMQLMEGKYKLSEDDTWGNYSGNLVTRDMSLEESFRNALIQLIENEESFYHKEI